MCFHLSRKNPKPKTAKRFIFCWKVLSKGLVGPFSNFVYKRGEKYEKVPLKVEFEYGQKVINAGYHSFSSFKRANNSLIDETRIHLFIIPKKSKYYYNEGNKQYVSDQIKMIL